jgi:hypothetical protein
MGSKIQQMEVTMRCRIVVAFLISFISLGLAQTRSAQTPASTQLEEMKKLSFLVGEWKGEGWVEFIPGQRRTSPISETIQSKLGGLVLLLEGLGKTKVPGREEEVVVHNALAVLWYDEKAKLYRMRSFLADGHSVDAEARFTEEGFRWGFQAPQGSSIRYTLKLTEKGEWFEIGELSPDGKTWRKFHEMTLQRVK